VVEQSSDESGVLGYLCSGLMNGLMSRQSWINVWATEVWEEFGRDQLGVKDKVIPHSCEQSGKYDLVSIRVETISVDAG
jgi:hypothetical protein